MNLSAKGTSNAYLFAGEGQSIKTRSDYATMRKKFVTNLRLRGIEHVLKDELLFSPRGMPGPDELRPSDEMLNQQILVPPAGADFQTVLATTQANLKTRERHDALVKDYWDRARKGEKELGQALGELINLIAPKSPAMQIIDRNIEKYDDLVEEEAADPAQGLMLTFNYRKLRWSLDELDKKYLITGTTESETDIVQQLKSTTDERHTVDSRNAIWSELVQRLNMLPEHTTTERQLYDYYAKGVHNSFLRTFVAIHQADTTDASPKTWDHLSNKLSTLIQSQPEMDTKVMEPASSGPTIRANSAATKEPYSGPCLYCSSSKHITKECDATVCNDCGRALDRSNRRQHWGTKGCPTRSANAGRPFDRNQIVNMYGKRTYNEKRKRSHSKYGPGDQPSQARDMSSQPPAAKSAKVDATSIDADQFKQFQEFKAYQASLAAAYIAQGNKP